MLRHPPGAQHRVVNVSLILNRSRRAREPRRGCGLNDPRMGNERFPSDVMWMRHSLAHRQYRREARIGIFKQRTPLRLLFTQKTLLESCPHGGPAMAIQVIRKLTRRNAQLLEQQRE